MPGVSKWSVYLRFSHQNPAYTCLPHACYMPYSSHSPWFDHRQNVGSALQIIQLLIMQSSPPPPYPLPVTPKYLPHNLFSDTLPLRASIYMRYSFTRSKIIVLYMLIFIFYIENWRTEISNRKIGSFARIKSTLNFLLSGPVIPYGCSQIFELFHAFKGFIIHHYIIILSSILITNTMYLLISTFLDHSPYQQIINLLCFPYMMHASAQYIIIISIN